MRKHLLPLIALITYSIILIMVMIFRHVPIIRIDGHVFNFGGRDANGLANLIPFKTILPYLLGKKGLAIAVFELIGNIGLLIPFGFLVAFIFRNMTWRKSFILAFVTGFMIEGMQALLHTGIFDIDDILLNGLGVVIGCWVFTILQRR